MPEGSLSVSISDRNRSIEKISKLCDFVNSGRRRNENDFWQGEVGLTVYFKMSVTIVDWQKNFFISNRPKRPKWLTLYIEVGNVNSQHKKIFIEVSFRINPLNLQTIKLTGSLELMCKFKCFNELN